MAIERPTARLGPDVRTAALARMAEERFDVVIVGGGVTGAGAALDAASRGLSVALVEQRDLSSGTSSRSSKLIHGGLRYLEQLDFKLVREALHERGLLLGTLAPHLVWPVPFIYPFSHRVWERAYVTAGVSMYDGLATIGADNPLPLQRQLSKRSMLELFPALDPERFVGGIRYYDAGCDDARLVVSLARTAAAHGAAIATSTRAIGMARDGDRRISGVVAVDAESGREITIRGRVVINATGVWTDDVERLAGDREPLVTASKGIHIVVPRDRIRADCGLITKTEKSVLFVIPFGNHWLIGTTDTPWKLSKAHPAASRTDIDYVLDHANTLLAEPLTHDDVTGVYAGLRPLVTGDAQSTAKLSREHVITRPAAGLVTIAGGKYTTYRVMAEDVVDEATADFATPPGPTRTADIPLHGAEGWERRWNDRVASAAAAGVSVELMEHLLRRHGSDTDHILQLARERPDLGEPIVPDAPYLRAEVLWAVEHEAALHLDDVLTRRTRISIEVPDRGLAAAQVCARIMGPILGWDAETADRELEHYRARVAAERESQAMPDDQTADAARMGAPDVRLMGA